MLKLRKIILTIMASATILGLGANLQPTLASARHVRTYRVRRHRTYRHRHFVKRNRTRSKNVKRTRRNKQNRRMKRTKKTKMTKRTKRTKRSKRNYRPRVRRHQRATRSRNMFSEFSKAQLRHLAKLDYEPLKEFESDETANNNGHIYGPSKIYNMDGQMWIFTRPGLRYYARINHVSVPKALNLYQKHATKYWNYQGAPTKLAIQEADRDAINDLNQDREAAGVQPLTPDPGLQLVAEKRSQQMSYQIDHNIMPTHTDPKSGDSYAHEIAQKYNVTSPYGENIGSEQGSNFSTPSKLGHDENTSWWDPGHKAVRMNPNYNYVGISIDGYTAEEFA